MNTVTHKGMQRRAFATGGFVDSLRSKVQTAYKTSEDRLMNAEKKAMGPAPVAAPVVVPPKPKTLGLGVKAPVTAAVNTSAQDARNAHMRAQIDQLKATGDAASIDRARQMEEGLKGYAKGGKVPGKGNKDTVPAMLTPGEFVMRKAAVQKHGMDKMKAMNRAGMKRRG